jgi:hypothetical protein
MAKSRTPSENTVPHQQKYDHDVPFIGKTTALPLSAPTGVTQPPPKTVTPSRFWEFMNISHTNGKREE